MLNTKCVITNDPIVNDARKVKNVKYFRFSLTR